MNWSDWIDYLDTLEEADRISFDGCCGCYNCQRIRDGFKIYEMNKAVQQDRIDNGEALDNARESAE